MDEGVAPLPPSGHTEPSTQDSVQIKASNSIVTVREGDCTLFVDQVNEDYHLTLAVDHDPSHRERLLGYAGNLGLGLMSLDECEPDVLEDGTIRHYLAEVIPV